MEPRLRVKVGRRLGAQFIEGRRENNRNGVHSGLYDMKARERLSRVNRGGGVGLKRLAAMHPTKFG